ncbi:MULTISPECIES: monofunctional biosynthetic peptidoglycan transglycosylase [Oleiagrimonas]|uniref:Biosynthetic peptidoglycan transglycosylase n=1 Tax=Oleiagrimonas citrea TaxID=1665687 RepID=A0A846ZL55_9GAMM|nr:MULTISPECIES: monofunctional biosynthetic peptidoglycan transglycosylase [Oleiagrimonas]NKZ38250.1 monofunctional biosynthetic peptidoglycan transglycosylase [Oleiagrimonas citrea]RAP58451.1 monofunctional biosynthetic peptidoglycan transglycosylase [Oleiagrimonas sp. MCCC 1A03011]
MKSGKRPLWKRLLRGALWALLIWFVVTESMVLVLRFVPPWTSAFMVERQLSAWRHGEKDFHLRYHWVPWSKISKQVPLAMVASEDQKFPFHHGFDVASIQKAIDTAEDGGRLRGASTISQQTAKNLFLWGGRSFFRKGLEAYFTVLLETTWPKRRILEVYVNIAELGNGIYGVDAASHAYWHTDPSQLNSYQGALLAAVLPNPRRMHADRPSAYVQRRVAWIQQQMTQLGGTAYVTEKHPPHPRAQP